MFSQTRVGVVVREEERKKNKRKEKNNNAGGGGSGSGSGAGLDWTNTRRNTSGAARERRGGEIKIKNK